MTKDQRGIASFTIRFTQHLWRDSEGEPKVQWRGQIRHVQGDEQITFTDLADALQFIQHHLTQLALDATSADEQEDQEKVLHENFKIWEQFASSYSNIMYAAMERSMDQSEVLKAQMDEAMYKALNAWQTPASSDQEQVITALSELSAQIQTLKAKMDSLENTLKEA